MSPTFEACLRSWRFDPWLACALVIAGCVYLRGWLVLYRRDPWRWHGRRVAAFFSALATIYLALASPIEPFAALLLQVHMLQHLLLMMVVPPLVWLGAPYFPLLRGLPEAIRFYWAAPVLSSPPLRRFARRLTHPAIALVLFIVITWFWHLPALYDLALRSSNWHYLQHVCFLVAGLVFWYPIVRPYPFRPRWSPWLLLPVLLVADLSNTALAALLTFSDRVLYPYYAEVPRIGGHSVLDDQAAAGVIMWVPGSIAFLVPLFAIGVRLLSGSSGPSKKRRCGHKAPRRFLSTVLSPLNVFGRASVSPSRYLRNGRSGFDVLRLPIISRFLKWRYARLCFQVPLAALAAAVIYDGLRGPQVGAMNLAGVLPWIHWRGVIIFGLLVAGNVFCMGCPFMLPRTIARRFLPAGRSWPRWLRHKMDRRLSNRHIPVGLRGACAVGSAVVDRVDRDRVFRGCSSGRWCLQRRFVLQVCLPHWPIQFRAVVGFASGGEGARFGCLPNVQNKGLHPWPRRNSRLRAASFPAAEGGQHGLHHVP